MSPTTAQASGFVRATRLRSIVVGLGPLLAIAGLVLALRTVPSDAFVFVAVVTLLGGLTVLLTFRWPIVGLYTVLLGCAMFETFPVAGDPTSEFTWLFHANLSSSGLGPVPVSPLEALLMLTATAWFAQAAHRRQLALPLGALGAPVIAFGVCILAGLVYGVAINRGELRVALWELRAPAYVLIAYGLTTALLRSTRQIRAMTSILVIGLMLNVLRLLARYFTSPQGFVEGAQGVSGSSHENALFLALLIVMLIAHLSLGRWGAQSWLALLSLPPVAFALLVSQRRAAIAALALGLVVWATILFWQRRSLFLKIIPPLLLVVACYVGAFWARPVGVFGQPMRAIHTVLGTAPASDRDKSSDLYRVIEAQNIWLTLRINPLAGVGFGKPFIEFIPMVALDGWEFQFYTPHNQVLWIWLKMGLPGFVVTMWLFGASVARAARLVIVGSLGELTPFAVAIATFIVMLPLFAYVDIGFASGRPMLLLGALLGVCVAMPALLAREASLAAPARDERTATARLAPARIARTASPVTVVAAAWPDRERAKGFPQ